MDLALQVHSYWFGRLPLDRVSLDERMRLWFGKDATATEIAATDRDIAARFGDLVERALRGELDAWGDGPRRRLALILLLDQFPRSLHRGTARAFAGDEKALSLTLDGLQRAADAALDPVERLFFYMPLQHAENAEVQEESVAAFSRLVTESPSELRPVFEGSLLYARQHAEIVARFGRFPHRNAALGRSATPDEDAWLRAGGERFGQ